MTFRRFQILLSSLLLLTLFSTITWAQPEFKHIVPSMDQSLPVNEIDRLYLDGQYALAYDELAAYLNETNSVSAAQLQNFALLHRLLGLGDGIEYLRLAYEYEPESQFTTLALGTALMARDSLERAEHILREAVSLDDKFGESQIELAKCLRLQGKLDEAENLLSSLINRDRSDGEAYVELARVYLDRGGYEDADKAARVLLDAEADFLFEPVLRERLQLLVNRRENARAVEIGTLYLAEYPKSEYASEVAALLREIDPGGRYSADGIYVHDGYEGGQPYIDPSESMSVGQRLTWHAKYGVIGLGYVTGEMAEGSYKGEPCWIGRYTARASVPFVAIEDTFYAWIDKDLRFTRRLDMIYHESELKSRKTLENDYDRGISEIRVWEPSGYWWYDKLPAPPSLFDATSQMWYTQQLVMAGRSGECNVSIDHTYENTIIEYDGPDGTMEFLGEEMPVVKLHGQMPYTAIAGLTGEFTGWYTKNHQALPAKAKFKIFLGSITIWLDSLEPSEFGPVDMNTPQTNRPQKHTLLAEPVLPDDTNTPPDSLQRSHDDRRMMPME